MQPTTDDGWKAVGDAYAAVKNYALPDQVVAAAWCLGAVLSAMQQKEKLLGVPERIAAFNRTCDETLAFMQREIAALRLPPPR